MPQVSHGGDASRSSDAVAQHSLWGGTQLWQNPGAPLPAQQLPRQDAGSAPPAWPASDPTASKPVDIHASNARGVPPGFTEQLLTRDVPQTTGSAAPGSRGPPPGFGAPPQDRAPPQRPPAQESAAVNGLQGLHSGGSWQQHGSAPQQMPGVDGPGQLSADLQRLGLGPATMQQRHQHWQHDAPIAAAAGDRQGTAELQQPGAPGPSDQRPAGFPAISADLQRLGLGHVALQQYQQRYTAPPLPQQHSQQPGPLQSQPSLQSQPQHQVQQPSQPLHPQYWQHQGGMQRSHDTQPAQAPLQQELLQLPLQTQLPSNHQHFASSQNGTPAPPGPAVGPPEQQSQQLLVASQLQQQQAAQHQRDLQRQAEQRQALLWALQQPDQRAALEQVLQRHPELQQQLQQMAAQSQPQPQPELQPQPQPQQQQQMQEQAAQPPAAPQHNHSLSAPQQQERQPSPMRPRSHARYGRASMQCHLHLTSFRCSMSNAGYSSGVTSSWAQTVR